MSTLETTFRPTTVIEWRSLPDDILAGIFEEIEEQYWQNRAEEHWAWPFVAPFLNPKSGRA
jgi:hypothetical protein